MLRGKSFSSSDVVTQLNHLYDDYWEFILKEYPLTATYLGDHRYDGSLEDASEDAFNRRLAQSKKYLDRLKSIKKPLSKPDELNYELFQPSSSLSPTCRPGDSEHASRSESQNCSCQSDCGKDHSPI